MQRVGDGEADQRFLPPRQRAVFLNGVVPVHELGEQVGTVLADLVKRFRSLSS